jgi:SpoVK/Ycf46/Vps4 family AAA+-type ATPase
LRLRQHNEAEALRSWKTALDQIYYHNAYRMPSNYRAKTETEKALQDSLRQLELQCKERVDLLEALKKSRDDANKPAVTPSPTPPVLTPPGAHESSANVSNWLAEGTIAPVKYSELYKPPLPHRPSLPPRKQSSSSAAVRLNASRPSLSPHPSAKHGSRTPSPEKKSRGMLRTLRPGGKDGRPSSSRAPNSARNGPPEASKAATLAFGSNAAAAAANASRSVSSTSVATRETAIYGAALGTKNRSSSERPRTDSAQMSKQEPNPPRSPLYSHTGASSGSNVYVMPPLDSRPASNPLSIPLSSPPIIRKEVPSPLSERNSMDLGRLKSNQANSSAMPSYRSEYLPTSPDPRAIASKAASRSWSDHEPEKYRGANGKPATSSRPQNASNSHSNQRRTNPGASLAPAVLEGSIDNGPAQRPVRRRPKPEQDTARADLPPTPTSDAEGSTESGPESSEWKEHIRSIMKNLPRGVDEQAAQQILNDIVIKGDEVHWDDIAGLDIAKSALKETVVYPFLRPDLFMGLREPARGMLLFGPPGTGKTMLARAVATESHSTFFAISASSLTSKFLGESEKLVRALFALAKMLAPSIIFVDEIDSLLSSRSGSGEHEATRRIKTEFLIQWSDLAKAAAGREQTDKDKERGDASRVLVLAATNLPWAIDEAARRRFVRRQYIPLPEDEVRKKQLTTLLSHQKHELDDMDMQHLVRLTESTSFPSILISVAPSLLAHATS